MFRGGGSALLDFGVVARYGIALQSPMLAENSKQTFSIPLFVVHPPVPQRQGMPFAYSEMSACPTTPPLLPHVHYLFVTDSTISQPHTWAATTLVITLLSIVRVDDIRLYG